MDIFIDRPIIETEHAEAITFEIFNLASANFAWPYGPKEVHLHGNHVGIIGQYLMAFEAISNRRTTYSDKDPLLFFIEDDVIVSPLYYRYLEVLFDTYPQEDAFWHHVYGISLSRPKTLLLKDEHGAFKRIHKIPGPFADERDASWTKDYAYLYTFPRVGTWAQCHFTSSWIQFLSYYEVTGQFSVPTMTMRQDALFTEYFYLKKDIWTPYFMQFVELFGLTNVYFEFRHEERLQLTQLEEDQIDETAGDALEEDCSDSRTANGGISGNLALAISFQERGSHFKESLGPDNTLLTYPPIDIIVPQEVQDILHLDYCMRQIEKPYQGSYPWKVQNDCRMENMNE